MNTTNNNKTLVNVCNDFKFRVKDAIYNEAQKLSFFFGKLIPVENLNVDGHDIKYVVYLDNKDGVSLSYGNGCIDSYYIGLDDSIKILEILTNKMEMIEKGFKAYNNAKFDNSKDLYDEMCRLLTDYEEEVNNGICDGIGEDELYRMLLKIKNNWESINNN